MILIKGGKIVAPEEIVTADMLVDAGRILNIASHIDADGSDVIDATGLLVLPGAIDSHVHFRDPEDTSKEDFSTGTASALAGGVTTIMDMPNYRNPPTITIAAYREKQEIAKKKARCDYQLRFGASETNFEEAAKSGAPSLKIFLSDTRSELKCSRQAAIRHFESFPKEKPVCVHAEDREIIAEREKKYELHHEIRDARVSQVACEFALKEAGKLKRRVHICHVTTGLEIEMCRRYPNATYEVTPNHLFLSVADMKNGFGKVNPPLRDRNEQAKLWRNLNDDTIIASDHAPHLISHKLEGAPGFPGVGTMLPLMLNAAHEKRPRGGQGQTPGKVDLSLVGERFGGKARYLHCPPRHGYAGDTEPAGLALRSGIPGFSPLPHRHQRGYLPSRVGQQHRLACGRLGVEGPGVGQLLQRGN